MSQGSRPAVPDDAAVIEDLLSFCAHARGFPEISRCSRSLATVADADKLEVFHHPDIVFKSSLAESQVAAVGRGDGIQHFMPTPLQKQISFSLLVNANELEGTCLSHRCEECSAVSRPRESMDSLPLSQRNIALGMSCQVNDPDLLGKLILA